MVLPGGGCALPGLQAPLTGSHSVGPRKRSAAGRDFRHGTLDFAGWRRRLTRSTGSSHRLTLRRPAQAQRRGRDIRHGTRGIAGWRLRLTRSTGSSHRLTLRRPAQAQRRRAMASGTVPVVLPGGGCALPGLQAPLTGSHSVGPRKRSAAGRDIRHGTRGIAGRLRLTQPTGSSHRLTLRRPAQAQRRRARYQARYPRYCRVAAAPYPAYRILSQTHTP
ncbi:Uncharacterised protein [Klebsiella pneumoniae]|nr:Uncharacterised protein [Klebsiella pneumoniae]